MFRSLLDPETVPRRDGHGQFNFRNRIGSRSGSHGMFHVFPRAQKSEGNRIKHIFSFFSLLLSCIVRNP